VHVVTGDGAWIWYEAVGDGPAVVLVHGLADDHRLWRYQVPSLAERYRVITLDVRGHGRSSKRPLPASTAMLADDVVAVADALGVAHFAAVGLSMGGGIVQALALNHPERLWGLGLVSTSSWFPETTRQRFHDRAAAAERDGLASIVDAMVERWFTPLFVREHADEVDHVRETVVANDPVAFGAASRVNAERDWSDRLPEIRCPTIFIGGADDPADATRNAAVFRGRIPTIETHLVEGASHDVPIERPDEVTSLLEAWLERTAPRR
jgi:3-oxoadipate enol-lactonase